MSNTVSMLVSDIQEVEPPKRWGLRPAGHRLVVWPVPTERMTEGGIVIPEIHAGRKDLAQVDAEVMAVGPNCWKDQPSGAWCKEGDTVKIAAYSGYVFSGLDGREYRVINDLDVVGVCEDA